MTQRGDSSEALSGVVMGETAGAALAGEGEGESVPSGSVKADGGALVARVLRSQGVEYLICGQRGPHLADPCCVARLWDQTHPHAPRAVMRLRGRRMGANHWNGRRFAVSQPAAD